MATELVADSAAPQVAMWLAPEAGKIWDALLDNYDYLGFFWAVSGHGQQSRAGTRARGRGA
jgi:hypothetical protein